MIAISAVACSGSPTQPAPWDGQVRVVGVVRDVQTNVAIAGAHVTIGTCNILDTPGCSASVSATADQNGLYALSLAAGAYRAVSIDGEPTGLITLQDPNYRGDFFVHLAGCVGRYGTIVDKQTRRPVSGASLAVIGPGLRATATSDQTGWFQILPGCGIRREEDGAACIGFNTTDLSITHPNYASGSFPVGRGFCGVSRADYELVPR